MDQMDQIYQQHAHTVMGYLLRLTGNPDLAEELTQETFYQAIRSIDSFSGDSKLSTWLCGIAKNVYRTYAKKHREVPLVDDALLDKMVERTPSLEDTHLLVWQKQEIMVKVHQLKEPMKDVM